MILNINEKLEENFSLHEFLYLPQWRIYAFPTKDQYENLKYLASKLQLIRKTRLEKNLYLNLVL